MHENPVTPCVVMPVSHGIRQSMKFAQLVCIMYFVCVLHCLFLQRRCTRCSSCCLPSRTPSNFHDLDSSFARFFTMSGLFLCTSKYSCNLTAGSVCRQLQVYFLCSWDPRGSFVLSSPKWVSLEQMACSILLSPQKCTCENCIYLLLSSFCRPNGQSKCQSSLPKGTE